MIDRKGQNFMFFGYFSCFFFTRVSCVWRRPSVRRRGVRNGPDPTRRGFSPPPPLRWLPLSLFRGTFSFPIENPNNRKGNENPSHSAAVSSSSSSSSSSSPSSPYKNIWSYGSFQFHVKWIVFHWCFRLIPAKEWRPAVRCGCWGPTRRAAGRWRRRGTRRRRPAGGRGCALGTPPRGTLRPTSASPWLGPLRGSRLVRPVIFIFF